MVADLPLAAGDLVVEYGPGTGALTESIARHTAAAGARYFGIERDPGFAALLRQRFPELEFAAAPVERVRELLAERGLPAPAAILSGLPLILLPNMADIVATAAAVLRPGGQFRTFSYLQSCAAPAAHRLRRQLRTEFASYRSSRLVLRNLPPAFVLCGTARTSPPGTTRGAPENRGPGQASPLGSAQTPGEVVS